MRRVPSSAPVTPAEVRGHGRRIEPRGAGVDFPTMPRGVAFDDLLDEKLAAGPIDSRPAVTFGPAGMATAYGFFFVEAPHTAVASVLSSERWIGRPRSAADGVSLDGRFAGATSAGSL